MHCGLVLALYLTRLLIEPTVDIELWRRLPTGYRKRQKDTWIHYEVRHFMSSLIPALWSLDCG